jgi:hypothetical protein
VQPVTSRYTYYTIATQYSFHVPLILLEINWLLLIILIAFICVETSFFNYICKEVIVTCRGMRQEYT